jgi:hypothetical protein
MHSFIEDNTIKWSSSRLAGAIREQWIIGICGASANQNRIVFVTQLMNTRSRALSRNPTRVARARGDLSVKRHCQFQVNERPARSHEVKVLFVLSCGFSTQQSDFNINADRSQVLKTSSGNFGIGILNRRDNSNDAGSDQRIRTRGCAAVMRMRFKRDVGGRAFRIMFRLFKRERFSVFEVFEYIKAFTHYLSIAGDHTSDERSGTDKRDSLLGQIQSPLH